MASYLIKCSDYALSQWFYKLNRAHAFSYKSEQLMHIIMPDIEHDIRLMK